MLFLNRRSKFDVFLDVLEVLYVEKHVSVSVLIRKANLTSSSKKEVVDFLFLHGFILFDDKGLISLSDSGLRFVSGVVPGVVRAKNFFFDFGGL